MLRGWVDWCTLILGSFKQFTAKESRQRARERESEWENEWKKPRRTNSEDAKMPKWRSRIITITICRLSVHKFIANMRLYSAFQLTFRHNVNSLAVAPQFFRSHSHSVATYELMKSLICRDFSKCQCSKMVIDENGHVFKWLLYFKLQ